MSPAFNTFEAAAPVQEAEEPVILIPQEPEAFVPVVLGAPTVLYETVRAALLLNVLPDAPPAPPLLKVILFETGLCHTPESFHNVKALETFQEPELLFEAYHVTPVPGTKVNILLLVFPVGAECIQEPFS